MWNEEIYWCHILVSSIEMNTWWLLSIVSVRINKSGTKFSSVISLYYYGVNTAQCASLLRAANRDAFFRWLLLCASLLCLLSALVPLRIMKLCLWVREILALETYFYQKDFNSVHELYGLKSTSHFFLWTGDPFKDDPFGKIGE